jgi:C4-dicarboxylate transporter DctM subunit
MGWVMVLMPITMLVLGFPIFLILLSTSLTVLIFFMDVPLTAVHQIMFDSLNKFALLAVPFFIFAGDLMTRGGLSERLLRWVSSMIGSVRGSLPLTSLGFAAVFGAISGATTAATAVDRHDHLRHCFGYLDHRAVRGRHCAWPAAGGAVRDLHLLALRAAGTSRD